MREAMAVAGGFSEAGPRAGASFPVPTVTLKAPAACSRTITLSLLPGSNSYPHVCKQSITTLVVGGVRPSVPMRTALTLSLATLIRLYEVDIAAPGRVTTTRGGESKVITFGVKGPWPLIST